MRSILTALVLIRIILPTEVYSKPIDSSQSTVHSEAVSQHTIKVAGRSLTYVARAGWIPLRNDATGEVSADIFFTSYIVKPRRRGPTRPLTFYTNGGPGGPATLSYLGPRSLDGRLPEGQLPQPPYKMVDNQDTWLTMTDLVFVDPVGTGYSRATKAEHESEFYNPDGDAESVAQFIQLYLKQYPASKRQPVLVAGHSYGTVRSALVADIAPRRGILLSGLILASSALGDQPDPTPLSDRPENSLAYVLNLPTCTATAFFHHKLAPDLQRNFDAALEQAEFWARDEYPQLLAHADELSGDQLQSVAAKMARLTGLSPEVILFNRFRVLPDAFLRGLFGAEWSPHGLYDSRKLKVDQAANGWDPKWETVLSEIYLGRELHFKTEVHYAAEPLFLKWTCRPNCGSNPKALASLKHAMQEQPSLHVLSTNGYYDFATPYFATKSAVSQFDPGLRSRFHLTFYMAGHAPPVAEQRAKVESFMKEVLATAQKR